MCLCAHTLPESDINSHTTIPFPHPPSVDQMGAFRVHSSRLPSLLFNSIVTNDASLVCCSLHLLSYVPSLYAPSKYGVEIFGVSM